MEPQQPDHADEPRGGADDPLRRLEERLDRASDAAERLLAQAADSAARAARAAAGAAGAAAAAGASAAAGPSAEPDGSGPPAAGWQLPRGDADGASADLELLAQVLQALRDLVPAELQRRLAEALRELLLALRALIDWYLEQGQRQRPAGAELQDIPIL